LIASPNGRSFSPLPICRGEDCFGERHQIGDNFAFIKVGTRESGGDLFVAEQLLRDKFGPPRHLHRDQDEFFYVLEGKFVFEIGNQHCTLRAGDSALGPRRIPHVWAFTGEGGPGRLLVSFAPAGKAEAFFREVGSAISRPLNDPAFWSHHGMKLLGPPLAVLPTHIEFHI
jgi:mannose-6-phosphate isomerase-like protein (cupin superfamily)